MTNQTGRAAWPCLGLDAVPADAVAPAGIQFKTVTYLDTMKTYSNGNDTSCTTGSDFPLVTSVMSHLSEEAIRALARKQVQRELRDASRIRYQEEPARHVAQRVACRAQSHMDEGVAQEWALVLLQATGVDARNCRLVRSRRSETLGDFVSLDDTADKPRARDSRFPND